MRDFGKVKSSLWTSEKFSNLESDFARLFYIYLLTNQHGNSLGCYRIHVGYMMVDLDRSEEEIMEAMTQCQHGGLTLYDTVSQTVFIRNFLLNSPPSNQSHAKKVFSDTLSVTNEEFRYMILRDLSKACKGKSWGLSQEAKQELDTLSTRCTPPCPTKTETETSKRKNIKKEKKAKLKKPDSVNQETWKDFLEHRKAKKAPVTKTVITRIENEAKKINWTLEQALSEICLRGWQGFKAEWTTNQGGNGNGKAGPNNKQTSKRDRAIAAVERGLGDTIFDDPPYPAEGRPDGQKANR